MLYSKAARSLDLFSRWHCYRNSNVSKSPSTFHWDSNRNPQKLHSVFGSLFPQLRNKSTCFSSQMKAWGIDMDNKRSIRLEVAQLVCLKGPLDYSGARSYLGACETRKISLAYYCPQIKKCQFECLLKRQVLRRTCAAREPRKVFAEQFGWTSVMEASCRCWLLQQKAHCKQQAEPQGLNQQTEKSG